MPPPTNVPKDLHQVGKNIADSTLGLVGVAAPLAVIAKGVDIMTKGARESIEGKKSASKAKSSGKSSKKSSGWL